MELYLQSFNLATSGSKTVVSGDQLTPHGTALELTLRKPLVKDSHLRFEDEPPCWRWQPPWTTEGHNGYGAYPDQCHRPDSSQEAEGRFEVGRSPCPLLRDRSWA